MTDIVPKIIIPSQPTKLGEGVYSQVYAAEYNDGNESSPIALKVIRRSSLKEEKLQKAQNESIEECTNIEIEALSALRKSPHVIQLKQVFSPTGKHSPNMVVEKSSRTSLVYPRPLSFTIGPAPRIDQDLLHNSTCLALERMDVSLEDVLYTKREILNMSLIREWIRQILIALQDCHDKGIVHRDVKPGNLLLSQDRSHIKLSDFGLSKLIHNRAKRVKREKQEDEEEEEPDTPQMVSIVYRSPDVLSGSTDYSYATDIWSLGTVAGELFRFLDWQEFRQGYRGPLLFENSAFEQLERLPSQSKEQIMLALATIAPVEHWTSDVAGQLFSSAFQKKYPFASIFLFDTLKWKAEDRPTAQDLIRNHVFFNR